MSFISYPFAAVVGQTDYKLALILNAIDPLIGGVMVEGPRGVAKSTLARAMVDLLPDKTKSFVNLPLGATEEMLIGTLDLQEVMGRQKVRFRPGILAKAHEGMLYIDEVNLLPDALIDILLDVSASGINYIERDGISHEHEASYLLLGTMNPDEGKVRPQLRDRFGLSVQLETDYALEERVEIVERREAFEKNREGFLAEWKQEQDKIQARVEKAMRELDHVECEKSLRLEIAQRCQKADIEGVRADIVWHRAARAHAALQGRKAVQQKDIDRVEPFVLNHRLPPNTGNPSSSSPASGSGQKKNLADNSADSGQGSWGEMPPVSHNHSKDIDAEQTAFSTEEAIKQAIPARMLRRPGQVASKQIDWAKSIRINRGLPIQRLAYRQQDLQNRSVVSIMLDCSGSVLDGDGYALAKGCVEQLIQQAYELRGFVVVWGFGQSKIVPLIPLQRARVELSQQIRELPAGGGTPLAEALQVLAEFQGSPVMAASGIRFISAMVSDGRIQGQLPSMKLSGEGYFYDVEAAQVPRGRGKEIASAIGLEYIQVNAQ